jgi:hypothetical protein
MDSFSFSIQQGLIERHKHDLLFYQEPVPIRIKYRGMTIVVGDGPTHANNQTNFMQQSDVLHANFTQNSPSRKLFFS